MTLGELRLAQPVDAEEIDRITRPFRTLPAGNSSVGAMFDWRNHLSRSGRGEDWQAWVFDSEGRVRAYADVNFSTANAFMFGSGNKQSINAVGDALPRITPSTSVPIVFNVESCDKSSMDWVNEQAALIPVGSTIRAVTNKPRTPPIEGLQSIVTVRVCDPGYEPVMTGYRLVQECLESAQYRRRTFEYWLNAVNPWKHGEAVWVVAEREQTLVGLAILKTDREYSELKYLAVRQPYRRAGLGSALIAAALTQAHDRGVKKTEVTYTLPAALDAEKLYHRFGFEPVRRTELFSVEEPR